jgi:hypothetical protein
MTIDNASACGRVLTEGYGAGAWHGPDLKAALADVSEADAFRRPGEGRHNIAEIALHHAYCARGVYAKLTGADPGPFVMDSVRGEGAPGVDNDWFELPDAKKLSWKRIQELVEKTQHQLAAADQDIARGAVKSPLSQAERFDLILGITCHAVYHAGQIQLIKKLR